MGLPRCALQGLGSHLGGPVCVFVSVRVWCVCVCVCVRVYGCAALNVRASLMLSIFAFHTSHYCRFH